jgi:prepilin-type N-terminal cleavage/methylation domain-containing protein
VFHNVFERYGEIQSRRNDEETSEKGFTLIELLIVIVVLGILAAIVIFSLSGVTGSSAVAACNSDAKTVQVAVQAYISQNGGTLPASVTYSTTTNTYSGNADLLGTYLHTWPGGGAGNKYIVTYDSTTGAAGTVNVSTNNGTSYATYDSGGACSGA